MFPPHSHPSPLPALLVVTGDLDLGSIDALWTRASAVLASGATDLRLDLSGVTFMDAIGIGTLVRIKLAAQRAGMSVRVTSSGAVRRVLLLTGLDELLAA